MLVATLENPIFAVLTILIIPKLPRFVEKLDYAEMPLFRRVLEATFLPTLEDPITCSTHYSDHP